MSQTSDESGTTLSEVAPGAPGVDVPDPMLDHVSYSFGDFTFDVTNGLRRGGNSIYLGPRELWLLGQLLKGRGSTVGHEALKSAVLSDLFGSHTSVYRTVQALRRSLDDRQRVIIAAVNASGYRIGLPVTVQPLESLVRKDGHASERSPATQEAGLSRGSSLDAHSGISLLHAADRLRRNMEKNPTNPATCAAYAEALINQMIRGYIRPASRAEEAFEAVDRALAIDPEHPPSLAAKGWLCGVLDDDRFTGLKFIGRSLGHDPTSARAAFLKAWLLVGEQRLEDAMLELERALHFAPGDTDLAWMKAWILCVHKRFVKAITLVEKTLRSAPESDFLWICDAIARVKLGEKKSAIKSIRLASKRSPHDWLVRANYAWVWAASGEKLGYAELLAGLSIPSPSYSSPVMSAIVHRAMGDLAAVREFLRIGRTDKDPWTMLAWCDPRLQG